MLRCGDSLLRILGTDFCSNAKNGKCSVFENLREHIRNFFKFKTSYKNFKKGSKLN